MILKLKAFRFFSEAGFCFLGVLPDGGRVLVLTGRWWKLAYDQIHDDSRTKAQSAKTTKKGFLGFCLKFHEIADQVRDEGGESFSV